VTTDAPPLPRALDGDPSAAAIRARLVADVRPLWRDATIAVPEVSLGRPVADALVAAHRHGAAVLGLEAAAAELDREAHGLATAAARSGAPHGARVSRLLFIASDGAERFYREVERITRRHAARLLTCRLDVAADLLGRTVLGRPARVKAILVTHKTDVADVLRALATRPA